MIGQGRYLRLISRNGWESVQRIGARGVVAVVAITDDGRLLLVEQHRPALGRRVIELPAGLVGDRPGEADESFSVAARRELLEETGYEASELTHMADGPSSPGLCNESISFFRASGLRRAGPGGGDDSEEIEVHAVPLESLRAWLNERIRTGALVEPRIFAGLYLAT